MDKIGIVGLFDLYWDALEPRTYLFGLIILFFGLKS